MPHITNIVQGALFYDQNEHKYQVKSTALREEMSTPYEEEYFEVYLMSHPRQSAPNIRDGFGLALLNGRIMFRLALLNVGK